MPRDVRNSQLAGIMSENIKDPDASSLLTRILSSGWIPNLKFLKRVVVAMVGFTVLLVGVAMIILPGPAFIVIPLGLAILGLLAFLSMFRNPLKYLWKKARGGKPDLPEEIRRGLRR